MQLLDYWKFIEGLGLFLFGMLQLETALKAIVGKRFKFFLKKYTTNRFLAILNGALAAAILQSSSIVLLMVIAFAGGGNYIPVKFFRAYTRCKFGHHLDRLAR